MEDLLSNVDWTEIGWASWDTLVMVGMSLLFSVLIGLPIGVLLFLFGKRQLLEQPVAYAVLSFVVNVLRSVPFIILLIVMIPFTVMLIGTSLGVAEGPCEMVEHSSWACICDEVQEGGLRK